MTDGSRWTTEGERFGLCLTHRTMNQLEAECRSAGDTETGGVLVGHYTPDESIAVVTEALPPPGDSAAGHSWFHRGVAGLRRLLATRWAASDRTYYLGEWHYHPSIEVEASGDDLAQMRVISADTRYRCREPIMLIVGRPGNNGERPIRAFVFPHGERHLEFKSNQNGAS